MTATRTGLLTTLLATSLFTSTNAMAFCGFLVAEEGASARSALTEVAIMRHKNRSAITLRSDYIGPASDFLLIVPVDEGTTPDDIVVLPHHVMDKLERASSPTVSEYWELDPCNPSDSKRSFERSEREKISPLLDVIETSADATAYALSILGKRDSENASEWLSSRGFSMPEGAQRALEPYISNGMRLLVARVDPSKLDAHEQIKRLPPIRILYRTDTFALPISLTRLNAGAPPELVLYVLSPKSVKAANYPNAIAYSNMLIGAKARANLAGFHAAALEHIYQKTPNVLITEYSQRLSRRCVHYCHPQLTKSELDLLGRSDVIGPSHKSWALESVFSTPAVLESDVPDILPILKEKLTTSKTELTNCQRRSIDSRRNIAVMHTAYRLTFNGAGQHEQSERLDRGANRKFFHRCLDSLFSRWTLPASPSNSPTRFEVFIGIDSRSRAPIKPDSWTLTRMRMRPETGRDIVFERGSVRTNTHRAPSGPNGELVKQYSVGNVRPHFRVRYVQPLDWPEPILCKYPRRGVWQANETHNRIQDSVFLRREATEPHELSEAVIEQFEAWGTRPKK